MGDFFSDDSNFHGDNSTQREYRAIAATYDPKDFWRIQSWDVQHLAAESVLKSPNLKLKRKREDDFERTAEAALSSDVEKSSTSLRTSTSSRLYNPYEGDRSAKQLGESLRDFLSRLPACDSVLQQAGPWISIANPRSTYRLTAEDVATFKRKGEKLLDTYRRLRATTERNHPEKTTESISRMLRSDRDVLQSQIKELAKQAGVLSGKWMLFPATNDLDAIWAIIAKQTLDGKLGYASKVATFDNSSNESGKNTTTTATSGRKEDSHGSACRLICIYTQDFTDLPDIKRVLKALQRSHVLDLVAHGSQPSTEHGTTKTSENKPELLPTIYYKCDAYSHLDISSGNEFHIRASLYDSRDLFKQIADHV